MFNPETLRMSLDMMEKQATEKAASPAPRTPRTEQDHAVYALREQGLTSIADMVEEGKLRDVSELARLNPHSLHVAMEQSRAQSRARR